MVAGIGSASTAGRLRCRERAEMSGSPARLRAVIFDGLHDDVAARLALESVPVAIGSVCFDACKPRRRAALSATRMRYFQGWWIEMKFTHDLTHRVHAEMMDLGARPVGRLPDTSNRKKPLRCRNETAFDEVSFVGLMLPRGPPH